MKKKPSSKSVNIRIPLAARKIATRRVLVETILAALDCRSHFYEPKIINTDPDFSFGKDAIVICGQCVDRMREAIGLVPGESVPCHFQYFYDTVTVLPKSKSK